MKVFSKKVFQKKSFRVLCFSVLVLFSLGYGFSRYFVITHIHIEVLSPSDRDPPVLNRLKSRLKVFVGQSLFSVSLQDIRRVLKSEPRVHSENTQILRDLSNRRLVVSLKMFKPLALLWKSHRQVYPLSRQADLLPPVDFLQAPDLPLLRGDAFFKTPSLRKVAVEFLSHLPPQTGYLNQESVSEMGYSREEGSLWVLLTDHPGTLKIGLRLETKKYKRMESVLQYLNQQSIKWRVIDARFSQKIVVRTGEAI